MAAIITDGDKRQRPLWQRLLWFAALWGLGVVTIAAVGYVIRAVMFS